MKVMLGYTEIDGTPILVAFIMLITGIGYGVGWVARKVWATVQRWR